MVAAAVTLKEGASATDRVMVVMLPRCPEGCLVHPSNTALRYLPVMLSPAPLRSGVGKGHPKQCDRKYQHAHKKQEGYERNSSLSLRLLDGE